MDWESLNLNEKSELMKLYIKNGITSLSAIKDHYNSFATGGHLYQDGGPDEYNSKGHVTFGTYDEYGNIIPMYHLNQVNVGATQPYRTPEQQAQVTRERNMYFDAMRYFNYGNQDAESLQETYAKYPELRSYLKRIGMSENDFMAAATGRDYETNSYEIERTKQFNKELKDKQNIIDSKFLSDVQNRPDYQGIATFMNIAAGAPFALMSPLETAASVVGDKIWDFGSKLVTGKPWGELIKDDSGMLNPGLILGPLGLNKGLYFLNNSTKKFNVPTRKVNKVAIEDAKKTGVIRPNPNSIDQNLYFYDSPRGSGIYGKVNKNERLIVPKENSDINFSVINNGPHAGTETFVTPDNIFSINYDVYKPTLFGRYIKTNFNPLNYKTLAPTNTLWDQIIDNSYAGQQIRDLHFMQSFPNNAVSQYTKQWWGKDLIPMYHGSSHDFTIFDPKRSGEQFFFSPDKGYAETYGYGKAPRKFYLNADEFVGGYKATSDPEIWEPILDDATTRRLVKNNTKAGSIEGDMEFIIGDNRRIKLADPVVYDNDGNVIPLSKRDDFNNADIRFSFGGKLK